MRLQPGDDAPAFRLADDGNDQRALEDYQGTKLLLYFYPAAFTPGCTTQACDFRDNHASFRQAGYEVLGISPDPPEKLADFRAEHELPFRMLSDPDHAVAERYGAWGTRKLYGKEVVGLIRSTIAIDEHGQVADAWYNVRAKGHVARLEGKLS